MRLVLLGAPGAGKGTQCKRIVDHFGVAHLSSGDILRQHRAEGTALGQKAQDYMDSGGLVPDDIIVGMMVDAIGRIDDGFVLDGFPRTVNQAEQLDQALEAADRSIDLVINLQVDDAMIEKRMTGRRSCPKCGAVYHIENMKPKVDNKCDNDGEELIQRPDDQPDVVRKRLETYHQQTQPVVDYYKKTNTVKTIDANQDVDPVTEVIVGSLEALAT